MHWYCIRAGARHVQIGCPMGFALGLIGLILSPWSGRPLLFLFYTRWLGPTYITHGLVLEDLTLLPMVWSWTEQEDGSHRPNPFNLPPNRHTHTQIIIIELLKKTNLNHFKWAGWLILVKRRGCSQIWQIVWWTNIQTKHSPYLVTIRLCFSI